MIWLCVLCLVILSWFVLGLVDINKFVWFLFVSLIVWLKVWWFLGLVFWIELKFGLGLYCVFIRLNWLKFKDFNNLGIIGIFVLCKLVNIICKLDLGI